MTKNESLSRPKYKDKWGKAYLYWMRRICCSGYSINSFSPWRFCLVSRSSLKLTTVGFILLNFEIYLLNYWKFLKVSVCLNTSCAESAIGMPYICPSCTWCVPSLSVDNLIKRNSLMRIWRTLPWRQYKLLAVNIVWNFQCISRNVAYLVLVSISKSLYFVFLCRKLLLFTRCFSIPHQLCASIFFFSFFFCSLWY